MRRLDPREGRAHGRPRQCGDRAQTGEKGGRMKDRIDVTSTARRRLWLLACRCSSSRSSRSLPGAAAATRRPHRRRRRRRRPRRPHRGAAGASPRSRPPTTGAAGGEEGDADQDRASSRTARARSGRSTRQTVAGALACRSSSAVRPPVGPTDPSDGVDGRRRRRAPDRDRLRLLGRDAREGARGGQAPRRAGGRRDPHRPALGQRGHRRRELLEGESRT